MFEMSEMEKQPISMYGSRTTTFFQTGIAGAVQTSQGRRRAAEKRWLWIFNYHATRI